MSSNRRLWPLLTTALLFAGWIAYLAILAFSSRQQEILSRPQLIAADAVIIGDVQQVDKPVRIVKVIKGDLKEDDLVVENLAGVVVDGGMRWPGKFIIPLRRSPDGEYNVAPIPASPGYPPGDGKGLRQKEGMPQIYPLTPQTEAQLKEI